jgi:sulfotransferase
VKQLHFISGLPRSGSTLLASILRQTPQFHAAMSSPVAPMMNGALEQMGAVYRYWPASRPNNIAINILLIWQRCL